MIKRLVVCALGLTALAGMLVLLVRISGPFSVFSALTWSAGTGAGGTRLGAPAPPDTGTLAFFGLSGPVACRTSEPPTRSPYLAVARADAQKYHLDPLTFEWKIWQESGFNPNVPDSRAGAQGIAQFMPETARGMGIDPKNPEQALDASARLDAGHIKSYASRARQLASRYGGSSARYGYALALAAYNAGPGALESAWRRAFTGGWPTSPWAWLAELGQETRRYVPNILGCSTR